MSIGFSTGLRALLTARRAMDVIGHNLANQNTPGYSRQISLLTTTPPVIGKNLVALGTGVTIADVRSVVNEALLGRIRTELSGGGRYAAETDLLDQVEALLADFSDTGLAARLQSFFSGATDAAAQPEDQALRHNLLAAAGDLALAFRTRGSGLAEIRGSTRLEAQSIVTTANELFQQIASLNTKIQGQEVIGHQANDLRDQRAIALERLAEMVGATSVQLPDGTVTVAVAGTVVVTGASAERLTATVDATGGVQVRTEKGRIPITSGNGRLGGLIHMAQDYLPDRSGALDALARAFIRSVNTVHATGIPASGPFTKLAATNQITVPPGANPLAINLAGAGLPFDLQEGTLTVAVTDLATGDITRHEIAIDPATQSVGDLVNALNAIPHLNASLGSTGKLSIGAASGFGFDFSAKLDAAPVEGGTFGDAAATAVAAAQFPVALTAGAVFTVAVDGGAGQPVTIQPADFADLSAATADEVAAAINAQVTGATASVIDGQLVVRSDTSGAASSLAIGDLLGGAAAALGLPASASGTDVPVQVTVSGAGSPETQGAYTFTAVGDGEIGITPGLTVEVRDAAGELVTTLDVGEGYEPGAPIEVVEGVYVAFSPGAVQGSANHAFTLEVPGETDTAGVLVAFGLNALFTGSNASDIAVNDDIAADPTLLAGALAGGAGDGGNFLRIAALADLELQDLGGASVTASYNQYAADVGSTASSAQSSLEAASFVLITLEAQRADVSGVNPDEELLDLERFQQLYDAAARYLSVLNELNDTLLSI